MAQAPRYGYLEIIQGVPLDNRQMARLARCDSSECESAVNELLTFSVCSKDETGVLYSRRMVRDDETRERQAEDGRKGAASKKSATQEANTNTNTIPNTTLPMGGVGGECLKDTLQDTLQDTLDGQFEKFWTVYPKKRAKEDARKAWKQTVRVRPDFNTVMVKLSEQVISEDWKRNGGQYVPYPATWLRAGQWNDVVKSNNIPVCAVSSSDKLTREENALLANCRRDVSANKARVESGAASEDEKDLYARMVKRISELEAKAATT